MQQQKIWSSLQSHDMIDKTVGIIGFGCTGKEIARLLRPFWTRIMATKRTINGSKYLHIDPMPPSKLPELLKSSDFVVVSVPLTHETHNLIGEKELRLMKRDAFLINVSRGGVVDEAALISALKQKVITGACCDVLEKEPLTKSSPIHNTPNLQITHHSAYSSPSAQERSEKLFIENLRHYLQGKELKNIVDKKLGY
jgi:phosphoglycerate dehydrogenase-like enzyme